MSTDDITPKVSLNKLNRTAQPSIQQFNKNQEQAIQKAKLLITAGNNISYIASITGLSLATIAQLEQELNR